MKKDKEVVLAAVQQDALALEYAGEEIKKDKEVVLTAVQQNGHALEYAGEEMKKEVTQSTSHVHVVVAAQPIG